MSDVKKETVKEFCNRKNITIEKFNKERFEFVNNEGFDDAGNEYKTLEDWIDRKHTPMTHDPVDAFDVPGAE